MFLYMHYMHLCVSYNISFLFSAAIRRYRREQEVSKELKEEKEEENKAKEEATEEDKEKTGEGEEKVKKEIVEGATSEKGEKKEESDDEERPKRKFVNLNCPQCAMKCGTFRKYILHLKSGRHFAVMRRVAMKQKAILHQMRLAQRKAQKELEKTTDDLAPRTNFCPLCKLNYKQPKATHRATEAHKNMKKFLMPYCKICKITLKSPMLYEDHCCSIEHLKVCFTFIFIKLGKPDLSDYAVDVLCFIRLRCTPTIYKLSGIPKFFC